MITKCDICNKHGLWFKFLKCYDIWGHIKYTICNKGACAEVLYMLSEKGIAREVLGK